MNEVEERTEQFGDEPAKIPMGEVMEPAPRVTSNDAGRRSVHGFEVGTFIGPYRLIRQIGEGGFGVVYLAEREEPFRMQVAVKVLRPGLDSSVVLARFEQERQTLARMDHPGIARVIDGGLAFPGPRRETGGPPDKARSDGVPYFVMEYVNGEPITTFCDRHRLSLRDRINLFIAVCEAVHHAHSKGVIHRDLKPGNILVRGSDGPERAQQIDGAQEGESQRDGKGDGLRTVTGTGRSVATPKIIDFGVAKAIDQVLTDQRFFIESGQLIGTPEYMSPEQAEPGGADIDTRSDVYALGVVLYQLLAGVLPFDPRTLRSKALAEIQRIVREVEPPRPGTRLLELATTAELPDADLGAPGAGPTSIAMNTAQAIARNRAADLASLLVELNSDLEFIPLKAMSKERERRYPSALHFADDLRHFLAGMPVAARGPSAFYRGSKFVRRHRVTVAFAVGLVLLLVGGVVVATLLAARATVAEANQRAAMVVAQEQRTAAETESARSAVIAASTLLESGNAAGAVAQLATTPTARRGYEWQVLSAAADTTKARVLTGHAFALSVETATGHIVNVDNGRSNVWSVEKAGAAPVRSWKLGESGETASLSGVSVSGDGSRVAGVSTGGALPAGALLLRSGLPPLDLGLKVRNTSQIQIDNAGTMVACEESTDTGLLWRLVRVGEGVATVPLQGLTPQPPTASAATFLADGRSVLVCTLDGWRLHRCDDGSLLRQGPLSAHALGRIRAVAVSADGGTAAVAAEHGVARFSIAVAPEGEPASGTIVDRLTFDPARSVAVAPRGEAVVAALWSHAVMFEPSTGRAIPLTSAGAAIERVMFDAARDRILGARADSSVVVWQRRDVDLLAVAGLTRVHAVAASTGVPLVAVSGERDRKRETLVVDPRRGDPIKTGFPAHAFSSLALSVDGRRLAACVEGGMIEVREIDGDAAPRRFSLPSAAAFKKTDLVRTDVLAFVDENDRLLSVFRVNNGPAMVALLEKDGKQVDAFEGAKTTGSLLAARGGFVGAVVADRAVLYDLRAADPAAGRVVVELPFAGAAGALAPSGQTLAVAAFDGKVAIITLADRSVRTFETVQRAISALAWSPDGSRLLVGDRSGHLACWDPVLARSGISRRFRAPILSVVGTDQGGMLIVAEDGTTQVLRPAPAKAAPGGGEEPRKP